MPVAEQQAAKEHQRRREGRLQIDRFAEIDDVAGGKKLSRSDRNAKRQRKGPDQAGVALGPPAAQAGKQAKPAQQPDRAIGKADHEPAHHDNIATVLHRLIPGIGAVAISAAA